jgi:hypothetical protein
MTSILRKHVGWFVTIRAKISSAVVGSYIFQIKLKESIKSNIPHKTAKQKDGCPWINRDLKRLIRKRDR